MASLPRRQSISALVALLFAVSVGCSSSTQGQKSVEGFQRTRGVLRFSHSPPISEAHPKKNQPMVKV